LMASFSWYVCDGKYPFCPFNGKNVVDFALFVTRTKVHS